MQRSNGTLTSDKLHNISDSDKNLSPMSISHIVCIYHQTVGAEMKIWNFTVKTRHDLMLRLTFPATTQSKVVEPVLSGSLIHPGLTRATPRIRRAVAVDWRSTHSTPIIRTASSSKRAWRTILGETCRLVPHLESVVGHWSYRTHESKTNSC